tara:strand:+ start:12976 stop:13818 length:843 start_codon:yes stop_codon:yes gene_type:complete
MLNNILIIGLGMMGGSLCKSIKKNKISKKISAFDNNKSSITFALKNKLIDHQVTDFEKMQHPDLVILCTPLSSYLSVIKKLVSTINKKTMITDIGSSKGLLHNKIIRLVSDSNISYVSSHPMTGSEKSGIKYHRIEMFKNKVVFIVDKKSSSKIQYLKLKKFWELMGAITYDIDSKTHDLLMSQTSHIAHLMSYIFMDSLPQSIIDKNLQLLLGGGIKEHVRLSKSNPQMWTDIFLNNNKNILDSLDRMQNSATKIKKILKSNNAIKLNALLESIQIKTK